MVVMVTIEGNMTMLMNVNIVNRDLQGDSDGDRSVKKCNDNGGGIGDSDGKSSNEC